MRPAHVIPRMPCSDRIWNVSRPQICALYKVWVSKPCRRMEVQTAEYTVISVFAPRSLFRKTSLGSLPKAP